MSGFESLRPDDATPDGVAPDFDADDLAGDERPVDEAAAHAHDVLPDDDKPVLDPDASTDPYEDQA